MTPQTIPLDQPPAQEWQVYAQRESHQPSHLDRIMSSHGEQVSYVEVQSEAAARQTEDEELPRKLPRKVSLPINSPDPPLKGSTSQGEVTWDFTPPETDNKTTILERPTSNRISSKKVFADKKPGDERSFQHVHTLRSHLSPARALIPCNSSTPLPDETCFISGGDDGQIKFWRVNRKGVTPKKGNFDILPQITFRGHTGIVTCLAESAGNIWSGGSDGGIRGWKVPLPTRATYGASSTSLPMNDLI